MNLQFIDLDKLWTNICLRKGMKNRKQAVSVMLWCTSCLCFEFQNLTRFWVIFLLKQVAKMVILAVNLFSKIAYLCPSTRNFESKIQCPDCANSFFWVWTLGELMRHGDGHLHSVLQNWLHSVCHSLQFDGLMWVVRDNLFSINYWPYLDVPANSGKPSTTPWNLKFFIYYTHVFIPISRSSWLTRGLIHIKSFANRKKKTMKIYFLFNILYSPNYC